MVKLVMVAVTVKQAKSLKFGCVISGHRTVDAASHGS